MACALGTCPVPVGFRSQLCNGKFTSGPKGFRRKSVKVLRSEAKNPKRLVMVVRSSTEAASWSDFRSADELQDRFGCEGVRFVAMPNNIGAELKLRDQSTLRMILSGAQITSYKPFMWHGGLDEMLRCVRPATGNNASPQGGIELKFSHLADPLSSILPPISSRWSVESVDCQPWEYAQVTLINACKPDTMLGANQRCSLNFRYVVTLTDEGLSAGLVISNSGPQAVDFSGSMICHLAVGCTDGASAVGLKGYRYRTLEAPEQKSSFFDRFWEPKMKPRQEDSHQEEGSLDTRQALENGRWVVESEDEAQCHGGMDRLYTTPPESFSIIDRGLRRSLVFGRYGFSEYILSNPGPTSGVADWDRFLCVCPAQSSQSVRLHQHGEWKGGLTIHNPGTGSLDRKIAADPSILLRTEDLR